MKSGGVQIKMWDERFGRLPILSVLRKKTEVQATGKKQHGKYFSKTRKG